MPPQGPWKAALLALIASLFLLIATPAAAQKPPPPTSAIVDADGDKVFDDLEQSLAPAAASQPFDVIVLLQQPLTPANLDILRQRIGHFQTTVQYPSVSGFAATLTNGQITALARLDLVAQIEPDRIVRPTLDTSTFWFGVQKARTDFGVDGNADGAATYSTGDIVIAILDTGIAAAAFDTDQAHVDLDGGKVIAWKDFINDELSPYDEAGCSYHGTHVSSIAAGEGQGNSALTGVAPGAALVGVKVLGVQPDPPGPPSCLGTTSQVNGGIQWVIDNKDTYNISIFNMSLGGTGCSDGTDSQSQLVNAAVAAGLVAVVSAGNEGPATCTISSPAAAQDAITVAAMADVGQSGFSLASFSSRGPTADNRIKPDIAAAGVSIAAASGGTASGYKELSGTSMASPLTAGTVALMLHANSSLTPSQVKGMLESTAIDWGPAGKDIDYGAGRLDAYEAIRSAAGVTGTNIVVPNHQFIQDSLAAAGGTGDKDDYTITVTDTSLPIAVTVVMPTWNPDGSNELDFDVLLLDKDGIEVDRSESARRQETIGLASPTNGPYTLRIFAWPGNQSFPPSIGGAYFFDSSVGGTASASANDPPTADNQAVFTDEDTNLTVTLTGSDPNSDFLSFIVTALPTNGSLLDGGLDSDPLITTVPHTLAGDQVRYAPDLDFNGSDSFSFLTNDGIVDGNAATVSITVNPVNDPPIVDAGPGQDTVAGQAFNLTANFTDADTGDTHTCAINWGDGAAAEAGSVDQVNDTCSGSHTYTTTAGSPFTATVTITDSATPTPASGSDELLVTVNAPDSDGDSVDDTQDKCADTPQPTPPLDSTGFGCAQSQVDSDLDGFCDDAGAAAKGTSWCPTSPVDNCPSVPNGPGEAGVPGVGNQTNTDAANEAAGFIFAGAIQPGDALGDACDADDDNDGFSDADERIIFGVGPGSAQELTPCRTDTVPDPWPPDNFPLGTPNRLVEGQDLVAFLDHLFKGVGQDGYSARLDIFNPPGSVEGQDLVAMLPYVFSGCVPPP